MGQTLTYFSDIRIAIKTLWAGFKLILKHIWQAKHTRTNHDVRTSGYFTQPSGIVTTRYPYEAVPIPDNGRNRLHNEIDDCIVCDLCAKVCPVNCIEIEVIKSPTEIGKTSDGSAKRLFAAKFDIDMAKCCYCGLCTTVCPTECLTMTKTFDYSEFDVRNLNYHFTNLSPEQAEEKRKIYEEAEKEKARIKEQLKLEKEKASGTETATSNTPKPSFKPSIPVKKTSPDASEIKEDSVQNEENKTTDATPEAKPKPVFKPSIKPPVKKEDVSESEKQVDPSVSKDQTNEKPPAPKPVFKPKISVPKKEDSTTIENKQEEVKSSETSGQDENTEAKPKPKVVFKPVIPKPKTPPQEDKKEE